MTSALAFLSYLAQLKGVPFDESRMRASQLLERVGLGGTEKKKLEDHASDHRPGHYRRAPTFVAEISPLRQMCWRAQTFFEIITGRRDCLVPD